MKAFIVAAMLVATVAGQFNMYGQDKSVLLNKYYGNELMYKKLGYPMEKFSMVGQKDLVDVPMYLQDQLVDKKIFTIDELYNTELFREYMTLPLFREYITVPFFQKYVQSVYFQKFWTVPTFKQYFVQPTLFYKYIYPIVQLFKYDNTFSTLEQQIVNKNVLPVVSDYERDLFVPTTYNKEYLTQGQEGLFYKNLLEKIYSQLYNVDETTTYKNIVDPITGEYKMIPFQGIQGLDTIFGDKLVKDLLIKKFLTGDLKVDTIFGDKLITDMLLNKNIDTELLKKIILTKNIDTTVFGDNLVKDTLLTKNVDVELLKDLLVKKNVDTELIKKVLLNKMIFGDLIETIPEEYLLKEKMMKMNPIYARMTYGMYNKGLPFTTKFDKIDTITKMNLFDILSKKDLINKFEIEPVDKLSVFDILSKKDLAIKDKLVLNKILADKVNEIENFGVYETPKMVEDIKMFNPVMGVRTFDKKMIPQVIKA